MRKAGILAVLVAAGVSAGGCATNDRYGYDEYGNYERDRQLGRAGSGAAIGAAVGAGVGAVVGGVSPVEGAIAGAVAGGAIGAATSGSRSGRVDEVRWYRDDRGYCFWVNNRGQRIYDYNVRC
jgi:outer membrane lipoprotein SlyB